MVVHFTAAAHDIADARKVVAVKASARMRVLFENVDVIARHLSVTDKEAGGAERGKAASDQICGFVIYALRFYRACKRFIITT